MTPRLSPDLQAWPTSPFGASQFPSRWKGRMQTPRTTLCIVRSAGFVVSEPLPWRASRAASASAAPAGCLAPGPLRSSRLRAPSPCQAPRAAWAPPGGATPLPDPQRGRLRTSYLSAPHSELLVSLSPRGGLPEEVLLRSRHCHRDSLPRCEGGVTVVGTPARRLRRAQDRARTLRGALKSEAQYSLSPKGYLVRSERPQRLDISLYENQIFSLENTMKSKVDPSVEGTICNPNTIFLICKELISL